jgi:UDP-N-acetylmuramoylalanine--D-glutamate ligase
VVILGGEGKGQDFAPLAVPIARYARAVILLGRDADQIRAQIQDCGIPIAPVDDMTAAVQKAQTLAQPGDAVLLSPACASFDMFRNYAHRAQVFVQAVQELAENSGGIA